MQHPKDQITKYPNSTIFWAPQAEKMANFVANVSLQKSNLEML